MITNLTSGVLYSFKVSAVNFNGESLLSPLSQLKSCVAPSDVSPPVLTASTATTVTLRWSQPDSNGGCPVTSYAVYRDDGADGAFSVNMEAATIANNPYLFEHTFTLPNTLTGKSIRYKLEATNEIAATLSAEYLSAILAGLPATPTSGPVDIPSVTSSSQIGVTLPTVTDNGGSMITNYQLLMDDG